MPADVVCEKGEGGMEWTKRADGGGYALTSVSNCTGMRSRRYRRIDTGCGFECSRICKNISVSNWD